MLYFSRAPRTALAGLVCALALCLPPLAAYADAGRDARLTVAQAYIAATLEDLDVAELVRTMYRPLLAQVRAGGVEVSEAQEAAIEELYLENMAEPMVEIMRAQDEIMADLFTLTEIEELYAFYMTPAGRSVMLKLPQLAEAQMPMTMELVESRMEVILPKLMEILD